MNKHIELVKKWLDDPSSVTVDELRENSESADADAYADEAARDAIYAAYDAFAYAAYDAYAAAEHYVKRYEELTEGE